MSGATRLAAAAAGLAVLAGGLTACGNPGFPADDHVAQYLRPAVRAPLPHQPASYLGVYEPGVPRTYAQVDAFTAATGRSPSLLLYYSNWGQPFATSFADTALAHGAVPLDQIDPGTTSIQAIAAGRYDSYLWSYAAQVRAFGRPVVIGFAREMNGWWYPWSGRHVSPHDWVTAWRHIVTVFRNSGASNVTWQWTINNLVRGIGSPLRWWPGSGYVTWVGIDGYYYNAANNFENVFGRTITAVRKFTGKPILVSEVGTARQARPAAQLPELFAGIRHRHLLGLVWFDARAKQDWRLEDSPGALSAFRGASAGMHITHP